MASLAISAYQFCSRTGHRRLSDNLSNLYPAHEPEAAYTYVHGCASVGEDRLQNFSSGPGCIAVLILVSSNFANAESEIIIEASKRLKDCIKLMEGLKGAA